MKAYILLWKVQIYTNILLRRKKNACLIYGWQKKIPKGKVKRIIIFRTESKSPMWQKILSHASLGTWEVCSQYSVKNYYGCASAQNEVSQVGWRKSFFNNNVPSNKNKKYLLSSNLSYFWLNIWSMLQWCYIALYTRYYFWMQNHLHFSPF